MERNCLIYCRAVISDSYKSKSFHITNKQQTDCSTTDKQTI